VRAPLRVGGRFVVPKNGLFSGLGLPLSANRVDDNGRVRRTPLPSLLTASGLVTSEQIEDANAEGRMTGDSLGQVIVRHGWASEEDIAKVLAEQYELPYLAGESFAVEPEVAERMHPNDARRVEACPVGFVDDSLVVALDDPTEPRFKEVRQLVGDSALFVIVTPTTLRELYEAVWGEVEVAEAAPAPPEPPRERPAPAPELDTTDIMSALETLESALGAVRNGLTTLVETSAAQRNELDECRAQLADHDQSRRSDLDRIGELEEQLAQRTQVVNDLKTKLGDFVSGLDAVA
jgi:hypothetical protein